MDFGVNETPTEVIKEGAFGGTYFRDNYYGVNSKWCRKSSKKFYELKNIDRGYYCLNIMMLVLIRMMLNVEHH